ncbi:TetR/AcrR family transcriptional regulator [Dactylosporangium sp. CA-233914]|uniref:TetR/AcrR family transcriptional regulator n=1 Tax=Dactylosporangium sp. CA-233914 TaxID=3239934 RepID=UPI003D8B5A0F
MSSNRPRRPRADAQRNAELLLVAAEAAFREHGVDAPLEQIARRAGVAIGTLYGHFPNRRVLLGALLRERNEALFALGDRLLELPPQEAEEEALAAWLRAVADHAAAYQGLAGVLVDGLDDEASELHTSCVRMTAIGERIVERARASGAIRADVTGNDVFALMNAAAWLRGHGSAEQADRLLTFAVAGMRPAPAGPGEVNGSIVEQ